MNQHFVPLRTAAIAEKSATDRPTFAARYNGRDYHVICFTNAFMFLNASHPKAQGGNPGQSAVVVGAVLGGVVGAMIGAAIAEGSRYDSGSQTGYKENLSLYTDDQLIDLARQRQHSVVCEYEDVISASVDSPGYFGRNFGNAKLVGNVTIRDKTQGKLVLSISSQQDMLVAIQALPKKLGDIVQINLVWDEAKHAFVPK